ncbi:hypothetical protein KJ359_003814 [Pestalotiopsis sp. 9143b]|nr:hypothetical protein KJ359_003814 [Pestalotiopsis sp. 9143b]
MNGDEWKRWRALFNPGFSAAAMLNNVPHIVDSALVFREKLIERIGTGMFSLDELTTKLTTEIILKVTLNLDSNHQSSQSVKSVITMALEAYLAEREQANVSQDEKLDSTFADYASYQIRIFLFAGTDTTASIMVYVYHYLAKHPDWLWKLREEHAQLFGPDSKDAGILLKQNPVLLNQCSLTHAFIKETLRLRAPAGTLRSGLPGVTITDLQGNEQPMDIAGANILHQALHVNPRVWPRPAEFLPERFLVEPGHELYPDPAAFRPFEQGPRNCIGQTLVWNELKIAIILTCRDLEIRDAYDDFDAKVQREMSFGEKFKRKLFGEPVMTVHGERAYQTDSGGLHPVNGYPCYVQWATD